MQNNTTSIDGILDEKAKALRAQHRLRLQQLRAQERQVANAKAEAFRSAQQASEAKSLEARAAAWEEERAGAVQTIAHQLDSAMSTLGAGHTDAQLFVMQRQRQRLEQEARQAVQAQRQAQRAAAALHRVRQEANQQASRVENHRARRDALLAAAREQASQFRATQAERAELQQDASAVIAQLEHERRRQQMHSLVDFKHSRLHEQLTPVPHAVLSDRVAQMPDVPDPVEAAKETAESLAKAQRAKLEQAVEAQARAQERFRVAQAKQRAERERQRVEAELAALEAEKVALRQAEITMHRLRLQDQNKQKELQRVFEENFVPGASSLLADPVERPPPVQVARRAPGIRRPHRDQQQGKDQGDAAGITFQPLPAPGHSAVPTWSTSRTSLQANPPPADGDFTFSVPLQPRMELPPLPVFPFMNRTDPQQQPQELRQQPQQQPMSPQQGAAGLGAGPAQGAADEGATAGVVQASTQPTLVSASAPPQPPSTAAADPAAVSAAQEAGPPAQAAPAALSGSAPHSQPAEASSTPHQQHQQQPAVQPLVTPGSPDSLESVHQDEQQQQQPKGEDDHDDDDDGMSLASASRAHDSAMEALDQELQREIDRMRQQLALQDIDVDLHASSDSTSSSALSLSTLLGDQALQRSAALAAAQLAAPVPQLRSQRTTQASSQHTTGLASQLPSTAVPITSATSSQEPQPAQEISRQTAPEHRATMQQQAERQPPHMRPSQAAAVTISSHQHAMQEHQGQHSGVSQQQRQSQPEHQHQQGHPAASTPGPATISQPNSGSPDASPWHDLLQGPPSSLFNTPDTTDLLLYGGVGRGAAGAGDDDAASSISSISMSSIRDLMDKGILPKEVGEALLSGFLGTPPSLSSLTTETLSTTVTAASGPGAANIAGAAIGNATGISNSMPTMAGGRSAAAPPAAAVPNAGNQPTSSSSITTLSSLTATLTGPSSAGLSSGSLGLTSSSNKSTHINQAPAPANLATQGGQQHHVPAVIPTAPAPQPLASLQHLTQPPLVPDAGTPRSTADSFDTLSLDEILAAALGAVGLSPSDTKLAASSHAVGGPDAGAAPLHGASGATSLWGSGVGHTAVTAHTGHIALGPVVITGIQGQLPSGSTAPALGSNTQALQGAPLPRALPQPRSATPGAPAAVASVYDPARAFAQEAVAYDPGTSGVQALLQRLGLVPAPAGGAANYQVATTMPVASTAPPPPPVPPLATVQPVAPHPAPPSVASISTSNTVSQPFSSSSTSPAQPAPVGTYTAGHTFGAPSVTTAATLAERWAALLESEGDDIFDRMSVDDILNMQVPVAPVVPGGVGAGAVLPGGVGRAAVLPPPTVTASPARVPDDIKGPTYAVPHTPATATQPQGAGPPTSRPAAVQPALGSNSSGSGTSAGTGSSSSLTITTTTTTTASLSTLATTSSSSSGGKGPSLWASLTGDSLAEALHTIQEEDEEGLAGSESGLSLTASLSDFSLTSSMHRQLVSSPALLRAGGGVGVSASAAAVAASVQASQGQGPMMPAGSYPVPGSLGGAAGDAPGTNEDWLSSLTQGVVQQGSLPAFTGNVAGGTEHGMSDHGSLSVTSSMGSDDFSSIMNRLLSDITQSLASAAPATGNPAATAHMAAAAARGAGVAGMPGALAVPGMSTGSSSDPLTVSSGPVSSFSSGMGG